MARVMRETLVRRPPAPGESCAITTYDRFKQTALLFDKVHMDSSKFLLLSEFGDPPEEVLFCLPECDSLSQETVGEILNYPESLKEQEPLKAMHTIWKSKINDYAKKGIDVIPLYDSEYQFEADYGAGKFVGYQGALNNIEVVDDSKLNWEQVLQFRSDKEAARKYRALRCWLREALSGKSINEATDIIGSKLDNYDWAIKKHGMKTTTSAIKQILNPKTIAALSGGATAAIFLGGPVAGALAGGLAIGARILTWGAERKLELEDIKRGQDSEVAIIYEVNRDFGKKIT